MCRAASSDVSTLQVALISATAAASVSYLSRGAGASLGTVAGILARQGRHPGQVRPDQAHLQGGWNGKKLTLVDMKLLS